MTHEELAARIERAEGPDREGGGGLCQCPLHTLFPQRIEDLVEPELLDLRAACDLIGKDAYGKPVWAPETISPCNPVVQAFARHRIAAIRARSAS